MYLRWKKKTHGVVSEATLVCTHLGQQIVSITPVFVVSARTGASGTPRQQTIWRPGGAMRLCCLGGALGRVAWWTATEQKWDALQEEIHGDGPSDLDDASKEVYAEILEDQGFWFDRMAEMICQPTRRERILFGKVLRRCLHIDDLGLQWPFTEKDLKAAWRRVALEAHPDRGGNHHDFIRIKESYEEALSLLGSSVRVA